MRGIAGLTAVRWTSRRKSTHPYQAQSITDALAALPPEPAAPQPSFTPARPAPDRETRPIPGLAAVPDATAGPAPQGRPVPAADTPEMALLTRVRDGMYKKWHAETFLADKRELPCFNAVTKSLGWQGLHMPPQAEGWRRWSTAGWAAHEQELADAAYMRARAQVAVDLNGISARVDDGLRAATGGHK